MKATDNSVREEAGGYRECLYVAHGERSGDTAGVGP